MATKEQSKYKTLLNMQTSANADLCPPDSVDGPHSPELLLGLDILPVNRCWDQRSILMQLWVECFI
jgi:hypothetical protein